MLVELRYVDGRVMEALEGLGIHSPWEFVELAVTLRDGRRLARGAGCQALLRHRHPGPRKKVGDYPKTVVVGDTVRLYAYVHNYLGYPAYLRVLVKLGDNSSVRGPEGFNATAILTLERILLHNESTLIPFSFRIEREGIRQRLILELWIYNTTNSFTFTGRWNQIWFNATRA